MLPYKTQLLRIKSMTICIIECNEQLQYTDQVKKEDNLLLKLKDT